MTPEKWRKAQDLFLAMMTSNDQKAILASESDPVVIAEAQRLYNYHVIFEKVQLGEAE